MTQPREAFDGLPSLPPIQNAPEADIIESLGDGLVLRRANEHDIDALDRFNAVAQADPPDWEVLAHIGHWTRQLMDGSHPVARARDFLVVQDTANDRVAATLCLLSHRLRYGAVEVGCGMPELVATHPGYRRRGLIARQFDEVHRWSEARGDLMQIIDGIPWYYRQFGYEMAVQRFGGAQLPTASLEGLAAEPGWTLRRATPEDAEFIHRCYVAGMERYRLSCIREPEFWRFETEGRAPLTTQTRVPYVLEDPEGTPRAFTNAVPILLDEDMVFTTALEAAPGTNVDEVVPHLLAGLSALGRTMAEESEQPFGGLNLAIGGAHPALAALPAYEPRVPYAWYVRVPDLVAFVTKVAPELEARLAASAEAGATATLEINGFREGLALEFADGRLREARRWTPSTEAVGDVTFPDLSFLHLLFGHRSFGELHGFYPDCMLHTKAKRPLIEALFPPQESFIMATS